MFNFVLSWVHCFWSPLYCFALLQVVNLFMVVSVCMDFTCLLICLFWIVLSFFLQNGGRGGGGFLSWSWFIFVVVEREREGFFSLLVDCF